jgi:hypothetical protein
MDAAPTTLTILARCKFGLAFRKIRAAGLPFLLQGFGREQVPSHIHNRGWWFRSVLFAGNQERKRPA